MDLIKERWDKLSPSDRWDMLRPWMKTEELNPHGVNQIVVLDWDEIDLLHQHLITEFLKNNP